MDTVRSSMSNRPQIKENGLPSRLRIIFVGHEASRTGAPIALLHFMRWLHKHRNVESSCLLLKGGPLAVDFSSICPTTVLYTSLWNKQKIRRWMATLRLGHAWEKVVALSVLRNQLKNADIVYCNTIAAYPAVLMAAPHGRRLLLHVHELEFIIRTEGGPLNLSRLLKLADRFIACSNAVAANLTARHSVAPSDIDVVHESIPAYSLPTTPVSSNRQWLRARLGVRSETFVVGGSGETGWRKGTDVFVRLAAYIQRKSRNLPIHFVWIGGSSDSRQTLEFLHDIELSGVGEILTYLPSVPDPIQYFQGLDLFAITSREDPYPLVGLEAASCGVPIVCFDRAGGMPEFVEDDGGLIVPYLNIEAMGEGIIDLLTDEPRRTIFGNAAQRKVRDRHDIAVAGPQIMAAIQRTISSEHDASH
jgi:glycosyltransferase involved in cell wall biosynthesis